MPAVMELKYVDRNYFYFILSVCLFNLIDQGFIFLIAYIYALDVYSSISMYTPPISFCRLFCIMINYLGKE